ncbi:MAG: hypothetical protein OXP12_01255 [Thaumarchaeota archaeon]|nr:hypothetical protein [Nitrososphaerota archaeon]MDE0265638.1 hypothetical protein [Nitrososphaerota archaeon]
MPPDSDARRTCGLHGSGPGPCGGQGPPKTGYLAPPGFTSEYGVSPALSNRFQL